MTRFILGPAGSGKTDKMLKEIKVQSEISTKPIIYLVPEQYTLTAEKKLLSVFGGAVITASVMSFKRLAYWVFAKSGDPERLVDDVGKALIIQKALFGLQGKLRLYETASTMPGFIKNMSSQITEFTQYGLDAETLLKLSESEDPLSSKLRELSMIFSAYNQEKAQSLTSDDNLSALAAMISECDFLQGVSLWVDGFYGFTPQEINVLSALMGISANMTFAFTITPEALGGDGFDPYYGIRRAISEVSSLEPSHPEIIWLMDTNPDTAADLAHLRANYFIKQAYPDVVDSIVLTEAQNIYQEINDLAQTIVSLTRNGYRYRDIGIITCELDRCHRQLISILSAYDIPVYVDRTWDILAYPLTEFVISLLDLALSGATYQTVFRLLKTGLLPISRKDLDVLENYVLARGVRGSGWNRPFSEFEGLDGEYMESLRSFVWGVIDAVRVFRPINKTVRAFATHTYETLVKLGVLDALSKDSSSTEQVRENQALWERILHIFERMVEILGDETIHLRQFLALFEAGAQSESLGLIPPGLDAVTVGDLRRSRLDHMKALFVIGINEGGFSPITESVGLLSSDERARLSERHSIDMSPSGKRAACEANFLIYQSLMLPTTRLYLSYVQGDLDGKAKRPDATIQSVSEIFPSLKTREASPLPLLYPSRNSLDAGQKLQKIARLYGGAHKKSRLSTSVINRLYGKRINTSVSRLERYVDCPFGYFLEYTLKARPRRLYELAPVDMGSTLHNIMEVFTEQLKDKRWQDITEDELGLMAKHAVDVAGEQEIFTSTGQYSFLKQRMGHIAEQALWAQTKQMQAGEFLFDKAEYIFGGKTSNAPILIPCGDFELSLEGRIDRIDLLKTDDKVYVKLIDYKTGKKKFSFGELYFGQALQLALYMNAYLKHLSEETGMDALPGAILYFALGQKALNYERVSGDDLSEALLKAYKMSGVVLKQLDVAGALDQKLLITPGHSSVVPVQTVKGTTDKKKKESTGPDFGKLGNTLEFSDFSGLMEYSMEKAAQIAQDIRSGSISPTPAKSGKRLACAFCDYKTVCGFDPILQENDVRRLNISENEAKQQISRKRK